MHSKKSSRKSDRRTHVPKIPIHNQIQSTSITIKAIDIHDKYKIQTKTKRGIRVPLKFPRIQNSEAIKAFDCANKSLYGFEYFGKHLYLDEKTLGKCYGFLCSIEFGKEEFVCAEISKC